MSWFDMKKVLNFNFAKWKTLYRKWSKLYRTGGQGDRTGLHTVRTHFPSTQKTGSGVVPGVSVEPGTRTAIYLSSKPCTLTQVLYLRILLPFLPLFYLYLSLSLLKSLSLFPFSFHIFTYTAPTPYSHSYFS